MEFQKRHGNEKITFLGRLLSMLSEIDIMCDIFVELGTQIMIWPLQVVNLTGNSQRSQQSGKRDARIGGIHNNQY